MARDLQTSRIGNPEYILKEAAALFLVGTKRHVSLNHQIRFVFSTRKKYTANKLILPFTKPGKVEKWRRITLPQRFENHSVPKAESLPFPVELLQINKKEFYSNCFSIKLAC